MAKDWCPITGPGEYRLRNGATAMIGTRVLGTGRGSMYYGSVVGSCRPNQSWYASGSYWPPECDDEHALDIVARIS